MYGIEAGSYIIYVKVGKGYSKAMKDILETKYAYKTTSRMRFVSTSSSYSVWTVKMGITGGNAGYTSVDDSSIPD